MKIYGLSPNQPTNTNEKGGKQSASPYRLDLIPPLAILRESQVLKGGAERFGEWNWKNIPIPDHLNHILQHVYAYLAGDKSDDHLANVACRAHFALELQEEENQKMAGDLSSAGPANPELKLGTMTASEYEMGKPSIILERIIALAEKNNCCIDCLIPLGDSYYGAGDGTGQKFRCGNCHKARQNSFEAGQEVKS